jgi:uncharacterized protein (UPF0548 family)
MLSLTASPHPMRISLLQKPTADALRRFVAEQAALEFSYAAVGATATVPPSGYTVDKTSIDLGAGEAVFEAAKAALRRWQQFRLGWVDMWSPDTPIEVGQVVAIMGWAMGFWWLNSCRIIYTVDETNESGTGIKFGFAYGTLPGHIESGEERFLIEWDRNTDRVVYRILAFSKPNHVVSRLGYPWVRRKQKQFGRDSAASMFRAVNANDTLSANAPMPIVLQSTN